MDPFFSTITAHGQERTHDDIATHILLQPLVVHYVHSCYTPWNNKTVVKHNSNVHTVSLNNSIKWMDEHFFFFFFFAVVVKDATLVSREMASCH